MAKHVPIPPRALEVVWDALTADAGVGVCIMSIHGEVEFANETFVNALAGRPDRAARRLSELMPEDAAAERLALCGGLSAGDSSVVLRETWRGVNYATGIRLLGGQNGSRRVLVVMRAIGGGEAALGGRQVRAKHGDDGPLTPLSPRERTVLSLVGTGMSTAQMAAHLGRSPKTIENQRHSIARKLGVRNRVEMARVAIQTGLAVLTPGRARRARRS